MQDLFNLLSFTDADQAAEAIVRGIRKRKARILVGPDAKLVYSVIPRLFGAAYADPLGLVMRFFGIPFARKRGVELQ